MPEGTSTEQIKTPEQIASEKLLNKILQLETLLQQQDLYQTELTRLMDEAKQVFEEAVQTYGSPTAIPENERYIKSIDNARERLEQIK